jgi:hypothetical protein
VRIFVTRIAFAVLLLGSALVWQAAAQSGGKTEKDGKWMTADGMPTYHIAADGTVDWSLRFLAPSPCSL